MQNIRLSGCIFLLLQYRKMQRACICRIEECGSCLVLVLLVAQVPLTEGLQTKKMCIPLLLSTLRKRRGCGKWETLLTREEEMDLFLPVLIGGIFLLFLRISVFRSPHFPHSLAKNISKFCAKERKNLLAFSTLVFYSYAFARNKKNRSRVAALFHQPLVDSKFARK